MFKHMPGNHIMEVLEDLGIRSVVRLDDAIIPSNMEIS